jgi:hypothetical protein
MSGMLFSEEDRRQQLGLNEMTDIEAQYAFKTEVEEPIRKADMADALPTILSVAASFSPQVKGGQLVAKIIEKAPFLVKLFGGADEAAVAVAGALGAAGGRAIEQTYRGEYDPVKVGGEIAETLAFEAAGNAIFRYGGKLVSVSSEKAKQMFGKEPSDLSTDELAQAAQKLMEERGTTFTPYQTTGTGGFKESVARGSVTTRAKMKELDESQIDAILGQAEQVFSRNMSREQFGVAYQDLYRKVDDSVKKAFEVKYAELDALTGGIGFPTTKLRRKYKLEARKAKKLGMTTDETNAWNSMFIGIDPRKEGFSFQEGMERVSKLKRALREKDLSPEVKKMYIDGIKDMEDLMQSSAEKMGSEAFDMYEKTSKEYREAQESLWNETIEKALIANPEHVAESITARAGDVTPVKDFYEGLANIANKYGREHKDDVANLVSEFQSQFVKGVFENVKNAATLADKQRALRKLVDTMKQEKFGDTLEAVVKGSKQRQRHLEVLLKASEMALDKPQGILTLFLTGKQTQAGSDIVGTIALIVPSMISAAINNPKYVNRIISLDKEVSKLGFVPETVKKVMQLAEDMNVQVKDEETDSYKAVPDIGLTMDEMVEVGLNSYRSK